MNDEAIKLARAVLSLAAERDQLRAALLEACAMLDKCHCQPVSLYADLRKLAGK